MNQKPTPEEIAAILSRVLKRLMDAVDQDVGTISSISHQCDEAWKESKAALKLAKEYLP